MLTGTIKMHTPSSVWTEMDAVGCLFHVWCTVASSSSDSNMLGFQLSTEDAEAAAVRFGVSVLFFLRDSNEVWCAALATWFDHNTAMLCHGASPSEVSLSYGSHCAASVHMASAPECFNKVHSQGTGTIRFSLAAILRGSVWDLWAWQGRPRPDCFTPSRPLEALGSLTFS